MKRLLCHFASVVLVGLFSLTFIGCNDDGKKPIPPSDTVDTPKNDQNKEQAPKLMNPPGMGKSKKTK